MNAKEVFRQTNILYFSLLAGQVLFCSVIVFAILNPETRQTGWPEGTYGLLVPAILVGVLPLVFFINNRQLSQGSEEENLPAKMAHYRTLVILRSALIEGVNLFSLVILLLENNTTFLIFFGAGLLLFLYFRPSMNEFLQHYQLDSGEQAEFNYQ
ncbi:hypothetical protein [Flavilitoribacter nigricans]|uniref:Uncharacterized protein n=1 Tax=Flavilitoribacter nigricans (strain ATCC 23147 / DSM 23189 / NBRC 102662 / NCIMB 1420 / SS-2) TaxID=1122177 RepID=A0A2D0NB92_FLAN2|nr:hypothetical protein [Flavilitoribacter nigricans]PHN05439.1 hypothetical protein CRP01_15695 [Flavilitoribacter nigricans DSM 23189 = NBRC 102662]